MDHDDFRTMMRHHQAWIGAQELALSGALIAFMYGQIVWFVSTVAVGAMCMRRAACVRADYWQSKALRP